MKYLTKTVKSTKFAKSFKPQIVDGKIVPEQTIAEYLDTLYKSPNNEKCEILPIVNDYGEPIENPRRLISENEVRKGI